MTPAARPSRRRDRLVSTIVFFAVLALAITHAPGWPEVKRTFFDWDEFKASMPEIARAFLLNVKIFLIAEALILRFALALAVIRSLPGPVFFPLRVLGIAYADFFRGVPTILVIRCSGSGLRRCSSWRPALDDVLGNRRAGPRLHRVRLRGVPRRDQSVHPSQDAAARSLGLSRWQSLRNVVLPQAVRRVIPPLFNDFIGLQKDTALVGFLGSVEAFKQSQIDAAATFNYTPYVAAAVLFIALTIPLARFTDWLVPRDRRRRQATGVG